MLKGHTSVVNSVAYSPDGKTLASGSWDKTVKLWDVQTGKEQTTLKGHTDVVRSVTYSPDGKTLASGAWTRPLSSGRADGQGAATLQAKSGIAVAFSPDGKTLALGSLDKTIKLWDMPAAKKADK